MSLTILHNNPIILAPMSGILNQPLRLAFRELGWKVSWVGSIDARATTVSGDGRLINILGKEETIDPSERPLVIQLIGDDAETLSHAAYYLEDKADVFDFNLGCPLKIATSRGLGVAMTQDPLMMLNILKSFIRSTKKPVTAKIRLLATDRIQETIDLAKSIEDTGISGLTIHARAPQQKFSGTVNWEAFRMMKKNLSIPVIGSGGIQDITDIFALREHAHLDSIMVGAGAIHNPYLIMEYREQIKGIAPRKKTLKDTLNFASLYAQFSCRHKDSASSSVGRLVPYLLYLILRLRLDFFVIRHGLFKD
jgi:tRNA-dihydrouridine synthase B